MVDGTVCVVYRALNGEDGVTDAYTLTLNRGRGAKGTLRYGAELTPPTTTTGAPTTAAPTTDAPTTAAPTTAGDTTTTAAATTTTAAATTTTAAATTTTTTAPSDGLEPGQASVTYGCTCDTSLASTVSRAETALGDDGRINLCLQRDKFRGEISTEIDVAGAFRYASPLLPGSESTMCVRYRPLDGEADPSMVFGVSVILSKGGKGTLYYDGA